MSGLKNVATAAAVSALGPTAIAAGIGAAIGSNVAQTFFPEHSNNIDIEMEQLRAELEKCRLDPTQSTNVTALRHRAPTRVVDTTHISVEVGQVLEKTTGIPLSNHDLFASFDRLRDQMRRAIQDNNEKELFSLEKRMVPETLTLVQQLLKRAEQQDQNPAFFIASQASKQHPHSPEQQIQAIVTSAVSSNAQPEFQQLPTEIQQERSHVEKMYRSFDKNKLVRIVKGTKLWEWMIRGLTVSFYYILKISKWLLVSAISSIPLLAYTYPSLSASTLITPFTNPRTGLTVGVSTYCFTGSIGGLFSVGQILNLAMCVGVGGGGIISVFGPGSHTASVVDRFLDVLVGEHVPTLWEALHVFSHFWTVVSALAKDIYTIFPERNEMFFMKPYTNSTQQLFHFVKKTRTIIKMISDKNITNGEKVDLLYYEAKSAIDSIHIYTLLQSDTLQYVFNGTMNSTVVKWMTNTATDNLIMIAEEYVGRKEVQDKIVTGMITMIQDHSHLGVVIEDKLIGALEQRFSQQLPEVIRNTIVHAIKDPEIQQQLVNGALQALDHPELQQRVANAISFDSIGHSIVDAVSDQLYKTTTVLAMDQTEETETKTNTKGKLKRVMENIIEHSIGYVVSHPEEITDAVEKTVSLVSPIIQQGVTNAVSHGFGSSQAEGWANNLLLGSLKGMFSTRTSGESLTEELGFIASQAVSQAASNVYHIATHPTSLVFNTPSTIIPPEAKGVKKMSRKKVHYRKKTLRSRCDSKKYNMKKI